MNYMHHVTVNRIHHALRLKSDPNSGQIQVYAKAYQIYFGRWSPTAQGSLTDKSPDQEMADGPMNQQHPDVMIRAHKVFNIIIKVAHNTRKVNGIS